MISLLVNVTPKAKENRVEDITTLDPNTRRLKVWVTAVPERGEANKAVLEMISRHFQLPINRFFIIRGHKNRKKLIIIK